jgi:hypothetical protein
MVKEPEQTLVQSRHTKGQQVREKNLHIANQQGVSQLFFTVTYTGTKPIYKEESLLLDHGFRDFSPLLWTCGEALHHGKSA